MQQPVGHAESPGDLRERVRVAVERMERVLPGQAPILNFVHHNTLHGYQHLPFPKALEAAEKLTGIHGYLPLAEFRKCYARGRITDDDIQAVLDRTFGAEQGESIPLGDKSVTRKEIYRLVLIYGMDSIEADRFEWLAEEMGALHRLQPDLPPRRRQELLRRGVSEKDVVQALWTACIEAFDLDQYRLHPEDLPEVRLQRMKSVIAEFDADAGSLHACSINPDIDHLMRAESNQMLAAMSASLGKGFSLRGLLLSLTGVDLLDKVQPVLLRFCASHLDEGLAALRSPDRAEGLFAAWKRCAMGDFSMDLAESPGWRSALADAPDCAVDAVIAMLRRLEIPESCYEDYLERLALELPGWSGMVNWRFHHPEYPPNHSNPASLIDFLAVRLFLDCLWLESLCRATWRIAGNVTAILGYFRHNYSELLARRMLFAGELPEHLANEAQKLIGMSQTERAHAERWRVLAEMIWLWKQGSVAESGQPHTLYGSAWPLFRLAQHLGLSAENLRDLPLDEAERLLRLLNELSPGEKGYIWLQAYERRYRENLFAALSQNRGRGRWKLREERPRAQVIFCMDDREESIRRHLEELNSAIETFGAAGFFGIPMYWKGLDDKTATALCPVVVTPAHEIWEEPQAGQDKPMEKHVRRLNLKALIQWVLHQEIRRNLATSNLLIGLLAPFAPVALLGEAFFPRQWEAWKRKVESLFVPAVPTRMRLVAEDGAPPATPEKPRLGFTDDEQAERVAAFLRNIGLTSGFAPLVILAGHGSNSQNNPHLAAYDCGACSGRHGGPNARAFAAMANRPEVRFRLTAMGICIPGDTWFLGVEHNTGSEEMAWYDLDQVPAHSLPCFGQLRGDLAQATLLSAHERCRRLASAPPDPSLRQAVTHVIERTADFSQARPELGHATNAAALVGRRSVTRGAFLDRRVFLISYDPTADPNGTILEAILLAVGPVGAGINLEYYFSTVNNDRYGCASKVAHNVTGLFGVMEGAGSDLRTGLPRQMIEIHEAMRLQLVCETTNEILTAIYRRQQALRELIGNGWLLLSSIHPESGELSSFDPALGFVPWHGGEGSLPRVERSRDWYRGQTEALSPALIIRPDEQDIARHAA